MERSNIIKKSKIVVSVSGAVCVIFLVMAIVKENFMAEWKNHQYTYKALLMDKAKTEQELESAKKFNVEIRQVILDDFGTVDRCISCHTGIDNPRMADQPLPYKNHSGDILEHHPVDKFGCTVCHEGQGRALTFEEAKGFDKELYWERPLLPLDHMQSSCGKCHLSIFSDVSMVAGTDQLKRGRDLFLQKGCMSCHKVRDLGGNLGTDMTAQGEKTKHNYSFAHIHGEHSTHNWLKEHFLDPQRVSPGSQMVTYDFTGEELQALITFSMTLYNPDLPIKYYSRTHLADFKTEREPLSGKETYGLFCAVCHGDQGQGKDYRVFEAGIPALNNQDFLAVASEEMLRQTILHGRKGRLMTAWEPSVSGLSDGEVEELLKFVTGWKQDLCKIQDVSVTKGNGERGKNLYRSRCGTCHGANGEGGVGPSINNQDLLRLASDKFLIETIVHGRENTAMPSWSRLSSQEVSDLLKFIRGWQKMASVKLPTGKISGNAENGKEIFKMMCIACHGSAGEGSVGPAILNKDFLAQASDHYLAEIIAQGRRETAMIAWSEDREGLSGLTTKQINDLVAYMRKTEKETLPYNSKVSLGVVGHGQELYKNMCAGCHGVNGEGLQGPALNNPDFLKAATNGFLKATIAQGRSGTAMRSWAVGTQGYVELSNDDINDIVAYIRNWQK